MKYVVHTRLAWVWLAGVFVVLATGLAFGPTLTCLGLGAWCLAMMVALYAGSEDALDARAALFLASFIFVLGPMIEIALSGDFRTTGFYAPAIRGVVVTQPMFNRALAIIGVGLFSLSLPMLVAWRRPARAVGTRAVSVRAVSVRVDRLVDAVPRRAWAIYGILVLLTAAFVFVSFRGLGGAVAMAFDPVARDQSDLTVVSGAYGLLFVGAVVAAYYASQRIRKPVLRLLVFLPVLPLILPAANRGALVTALLIAAAAASPLTHRRIYLAALGALALFPLISVTLLGMRFALADGAVPFVVTGSAFQSFLTEATMAPAMAYVVEMLHTGRIDYVYGTDLFLIFVWFVPRVLWSGKPLPLDFRLNEELGMNYGRAYGTPISLFGGAYINFTPYLYWAFLIAVGALVVVGYRHWRHDRLVCALLMTLIVDIVRVGDITREVWTFIISVAAVFAVRKAIEWQPGRRRMHGTARKVSLT